MRRGTRRLLLILVLIVAVGALAFWGVRYYLGSQRMASEVAGVLSRSYGSPVLIGRVDVGLTSTDLEDLRFYPAGSDIATSQPWLTADRINTDVNPWDVVRGDTTPHRMELNGVTATLDFDREGHLTTKLPQTHGTSALPEIHLRNCRLTLRQQGRPEMVVSDLDMDVRPDGDNLVLTATTSDPYWGPWNLDGTLNPKTVQGNATARTDRAPITQQKLLSLPFVSPEVWKEVEVSGNGAVELTLRLGPKADEYHYKVTLQPKGATVRVTAAELTITDVNGPVVVDDGRIILNNDRGRTAGGEIYTTAANDLDFMSTPSRLDFHIGLKGVDVQSLPPSWKVPRTMLGAKMDGRLTGSADMTVVLRKDGIDADGRGSGDITDLRLNGEPVEAQRMHLGFRAKGNSFEFPVESQGAWLDTPGRKEVALCRTDFQSVQPVGRIGNPSYEEMIEAGLADLLVVSLVGPGDPQGDVLGRLLSGPSGALDVLEQGVTAGAGALLRAGQAAVNALPTAPPTKPEAPKNETNYLQTSFSLEDVDVAQLSKAFHWQIPFPVSGRLTLKLQASIPLNAAGDVKLYRMKGSASSKHLVVGEVEFNDLQADVNLDNGVLTLDRFSARLPGEDLVTKRKFVGGFSGKARVQISPPGSATAELTLDQVSLDRVASLVPGGLQLSGALSGGVNVEAPVATVGNLATWKGSGNLRAADLHVLGLAVTNPSADARLERGKLTLSQARATIEGADLTASGDVDLAGNQRFTAHVVLKPMDLTALQRLAPSFRPPVPLAGRIEATADATGSLSPLRYKVTGTAGASDLTVEGVKLGTLSLKWDASPDRVELTDVKSKLYGGTLTGSGTVPLEANVEGKIDARFDKLDVGALTKALPSSPVQLAGQASGSVKGTLSAAKPDRQFTGTVELSAPQLLVQGIPADKLTATLDYRKGSLDYRMEGETLGGKFHVNGKLPAEQQPAPPPEPEVHLKIEGARLSLLGRALRMSALEPLGGRLDLEFDVRFQGKERIPVGSGVARLTGLRWGDTRLGDTLEGRLNLSATELVFGPVSGTFGSGTLRATAAYRLKEPDRSWFALTLEGVESTQLLSPWPSVAEHVSGPVDAHLRGRWGSEWTASGTVSLANGRIYGMDVSGWNQPFDLAFAPGTDNVHLDLRETSFHLALGRVSGYASLRIGEGSHVQGKIRFTDLDLPTVTRTFSEVSHLGTGKASGTIDLGGNNVRSLNDLTADVRATLRQTQAMQLPVLQQIASFSMPGQSATTFQSGDLKGRLGGGVFHIQELSLSGPSTKLFLYGNVSLEERLDLQATVQTGVVAVNPVLLRLLRVRIPLSGAIPLSLISEASTLLSNHVIHLAVTGTVRSPVVRVQVLQTLTDEAVRFFLLQATPAIP